MTIVVPLPTLRLATPAPADLDKAAAFLHELWHETYGYDLPADLCEDRTETYFNAYLGQHGDRVLLAWMDERLIGLAAWRTNCLDDLWVARRWRGRGVAARLLDAVLERLRERGYGFAQAGCEGFNREAIRFFQRKGWSLIGSEEQQITPDLRIQALVYSRRLT